MFSLLVYSLQTYSCFKTRLSGRKNKSTNVYATRPKGGLSIHWNFAYWPRGNVQVICKYSARATYTTFRSCPVHYCVFFRQPFSRQLYITLRILLNMRKRERIGNLFSACTLYTTGTFSHKLNRRRD